MAEEGEKLKLKAVLLNNDSGSDSDGETKEDKGDIPGLSLEKLNLGPAKKLLVLNLGGELCDRVFFKDRKSFPRGREPDAVWELPEPYCEEFLKFCLQRFEVGIWSSAKLYNISAALNCVMGEHRSKLLFIWDQDHCTDSGFKTPENKFKPLFFKNLKKLWDSPKCKGKFSSSNTLMIDDKPYKTLLNPPHTAIFPDSYKASDVSDTALGANGELRLYLEGVNADDVPTYVKEHPFGQPAITAAHPDWGYYSMVVRKTPEDDYAELESDSYEYDSD